MKYKVRLRLAQERARAAALRRRLRLISGAAVVLFTGAFAAPATAPTIFKVRPGDTFSAIAARFTGNVRDWNKVYDAERSQLPDPNRILPGMRLQLVTEADGKRFLRVATPTQLAEARAQRAKQLAQGQSAGDSRVTAAAPLSNPSTPSKSPAAVPKVAAAKQASTLPPPVIPVLPAANERKSPAAQAPAKAVVIAPPAPAPAATKPAVVAVVPAVTVATTAPGAATPATKSATSTASTPVPVPVPLPAIVKAAPPAPPAPAAPTVAKAPVAPSAAVETAAASPTSAAVPSAMAVVSSLSSPMPVPVPVPSQANAAAPMVKAGTSSAASVVPALASVTPSAAPVKTSSPGSTTVPVPLPPGLTAAAPAAATAAVAAAAAALPAKAKVESPAAPSADVLVVGVMPNINATILMAQYDNLKSYLERTTSQKVRIVVPVSLKAYFEATMRGEYDLAIGAPHFARLAQTDARMVPVAMYEPRTNAQFITAVDGPLKSPRDLKGKAVVFANPQSLVALYGRQWLGQMSLESGKDYEVKSARTDLGVGRMLLSGDAAAAVMSGNEFRALPADEAARLKIVEVFARIPNFVVLAHPRLGAERTNLIKARLRSFLGEKTEGAAFAKATGVSGIVDADEVTLRELDTFVAATRRLMIPAP